MSILYSWWEISSSKLGFENYELMFQVLLVDEIDSEKGETPLCSSSVTFYNPTEALLINLFFTSTYLNMYQ